MPATTPISNTGTFELVVRLQGGGQRSCISVPPRVNLLRRIGMTFTQAQSSLHNIHEETHVDTILLPALAIAEIAMNCADWPLEAATAATPPSSAAIRASNTPLGMHGRPEGAYHGLNDL